MPAGEPSMAALRAEPSLAEPTRTEVVEPAPPILPEPAAEPAPPTWATLYARYFGPGTEGSCGRAHGCHAEAMADADSAYRWLAQRGYIAGASSPLVSNNSCLRWFGGNMPPRGGLPNEEATRDLGAWAAAGARNN
jgi:hypothetical protein